MIPFSLQYYTILIKFLETLSLQIGITNLHSLETGMDTVKNL